MANEKFRAEHESAKLAWFVASGVLELRRNEDDDDDVGCPYAELALHAKGSHVEQPRDSDMYAHEAALIAFRELRLLGRRQQDDRIEVWPGGVLRHVARTDGLDPGDFLVRVGRLLSASTGARVRAGHGTARRARRKR